MDYSQLELSQKTETPPSEYCWGPFRIRYAYWRSAESRRSRQNGEDAVVFRLDAKRLAFALCDGVSQSFYGGVGAGVLASTLIEWLWSVDTEALQTREGSSSIVDDLVGHLRKQAQIVDRSLSSSFVELIPDADDRTVSRQKAQRHGTQSTFVCGLVEAPHEDLPQGRITLWSLGDSRMHLWKGDIDRSALLNDFQWLARESWTSKKGVVGKVYLYSGDLQQTDCILVHSDGLDPRMEKLRPSMTGPDIRRAIVDSQQEKDDDASLLEITTREAAFASQPLSAEDFYSIVTTEGAAGDSESLEERRTFETPSPQEKSQQSETVRKESPREANSQDGVGGTRHCRDVPHRTARHFLTAWGTAWNAFRQHTFPVILLILYFLAGYLARGLVDAWAPARANPRLDDAAVVASPAVPSTQRGDPTQGGGVWIGAPGKPRVLVTRGCHRLADLKIDAGQLLDVEVQGLSEVGFYADDVCSSGILRQFAAGAPKTSFNATGSRSIRVDAP